MSIQEREHLTSEIAMLEELLSEIPAERVIEREGFEFRLQSARKLLEELPAAAQTRKVRLTFRGEPVVESRGIYAAFAGKASHAFSEAVAAAIEGLAGRLGTGGPIAGGDRSRLLITGTATGSFGFEFEVPVEDPLPAHDDAESTEIAITKIQELFEEASHGEGEKLADLVAELDPRAVKKAREFLTILKDGNALCGLEYRNHSFRFESSNDVARSIDELADDNIREETREYTGIMEGILPNARQMELRVPADDTVLRVRIGREYGDVDPLKDFFGKCIRVQLHVTAVGNRKPRYVLLSTPTPAD